jgi:hypothetical protein
MIFGSTHTIAIECEITSGGTLPPQGVFRLWSNDQQIGDSGDRYDLAFVLDCALKLASPTVERFDERFESMTCDAVAQYFMELVYSDERSPSDLDDIGQYLYRNAVLSVYSIEGFDSFFVAMLGCRDGRNRLVWMSKAGGTAYECYIPESEYRRVFNVCVEWIEGVTQYRVRRRGV